MAENSNLLKRKNNNLHIQKTQQIPSRRNAKRPTNRYIIVRMLNVKDKEKILKSARGKPPVTYREMSVRLTVNFSAETMRA